MNAFVYDRRSSRYNELLAAKIRIIHRSLECLVAMTNRHAPRPDLVQHQIQVWIEE